MSVTQVCSEEETLWYRYSHLEGSSSTGTALPWERMAALPNQKGSVTLTFRLPSNVGAAQVELWLLRKALGFDQRASRYCKLNLHRISEPPERATIEFRQFPGCLESPLVLWGWIKFLGILVTSMPGEGDLEATLAHDSLLVAWWRQCELRLPGEGDHSSQIAELQSTWDSLWKE